MKSHMKIETPHATVWVFILPTGTPFPGFGGSSSGIVAREPGSVVLRQHDKASDSLMDHEFSIADESVWHTISSLINIHGATVTGPETYYIPEAS